MLETQRLGEERQIWPRRRQHRRQRGARRRRRAGRAMDRGPAVNQPCLKLTAYFGERQRARDGDGRFLADAMLDLFDDREIATSVMLRGIASFGPRHGAAHRRVVEPVRGPAGGDRRGRCRVEDQRPGRRRRRDDQPRAGDAGTRAAASAATTRFDVGGRRRRQADGLRRAPGAHRRPARATARSAICCTGRDSPVAQCFSASTAPHAASDTGPASSAATSTFR